MPISRHSPIFQATTKRTAASVARGTKRARGAATMSTASRVSAWTIPETGVSAPERILVAVRAIAPVAGMPPKNGDARLATPCATSSTLELCRSPLMPSATTAESRLSTAASSATVNAEGSSGKMCSARQCGRENAGKAERNSAEAAADRLYRRVKAPAPLRCRSTGRRSSRGSACSTAARAE